MHDFAPGPEVARLAPDGAGPPRGTAWAAGRPYASLLVCLGLIGMQVISWPPLFLLGVTYHGNELATALLTALAFIWIFLPLGAAYGIRVGMAQRGRPGSGMLPMIGVLANTAYLLLAILIWISIFSGVLSV